MAAVSGLRLWEMNRGNDPHFGQYRGGQQFVLRRLSARRRVAQVAQVERRDAIDRRQEVAVRPDETEDPTCGSFASKSCVLMILHD
jgi:hypothetical protein